MFNASTNVTRTGRRMTAAMPLSNPHPRELRQTLPVVSLLAGLILLLVSSPAHAQVSPPDAPVAPVLTDAEIYSTQARVDWTAPANNGAAIENYRVEFTSNPPDWRHVDYPGSYSNEYLSGLTPGTRYSVRVSARNSAGWGPASPEVSFVTPPGTPNNLTVVRASALNEMFLEWDAPAGGVDGYDVHYTSAATGSVGDDAAVSGSDPATAWVAVARGGATPSQTISGLSADTTYRLRVRAKSAGATSQFWRRGTGTVRPGGPLLSTATANDTTLKLTYDVLLNENSVPPASAFTVSVDGTTVRLAGSNPVSISGVVVSLNLAEPVDAGQPVTVNYRLPTSNPIRERASYKAFELLNRPVMVSGICGRTPALITVILARVAETDCADVASTSLSDDVVSLSVDPADVLTGLREIDLRGFSSLETLELGRNSLASLPGNVFNDLSSLETLDLDGNSLASLPANVFDGLSSLERLDLSGNSLTSLPGNVFNDLSSLQTLDLSDNSLASLPADAFNGLPSLRVLDLSDNSLASVPTDALNGLPSLEGLYLTRNSLTSVPAKAFNGVPSVQILHLGANSLTSMHVEAFAGLTSLTGLNLSENSLSSLRGNVFNGLWSLVGLNMRDNSLSILPANLFDGLSTLAVVSLDKNSLTGFPTRAFRDLGALTNVSMGQNRLTCLTSAMAQRRSVLTVRDLIGVSPNAVRSLPDCPEVSLSASPSSVREGSPVTITATVTEAAARDRRVWLYTTPGTAETRENYGTGYIGSNDYIPLQHIVIPAGETSGTGLVQTIRDGDKDDETFTVGLAREGGFLMPGLSYGSPSSVEVTIIETARVSVSATPQVNEGSPVTVTVTLSELLPQAVRIPLFQIQRTAEPGDYEELSTRSRLGGSFDIDIPAGQLTGTATIGTTQDDDGDNETFAVGISPPFLPSVLQWGHPQVVDITIIDVFQRTSTTGSLVPNNNPVPPDNSLVPNNNPVPTVNSPVPTGNSGPPDMVKAYDANNNGKIDLSELLTAMRDYQNNQINRPQLQNIIRYYLTN